jgi:hypothetical protein
MTYSNYQEAYSALFFHLTTDTLAAIANDIEAERGNVPAVVNGARKLAIEEGRNNMGAEEFDALMTEMA